MKEFVILEHATMVYACIYLTMSTSILLQSNSSYGPHSPKLFVPIGTYYQYPLVPNRN